MKHYLPILLTCVTLSVAIPLAIALYPVVNNPITLSAQKTANTRYFFVGYRCRDVVNFYSFSQTEFPSSDKIYKDIHELSHAYGTITFIYEFKNEQDFNNFRK